ncbi:MAG: MASE1 domain-containing protein [Vicinamibacterales bacterium]
MLVVAAFIAVTLAGVEVARSQALSVGGLLMPPLWVPSGVLLAAAFLTTGRRHLAALGAGALGIAVLLAGRLDWPLGIAAGVGAIQAAEAGAIARLTQRLTGGRFSVHVTRDLGIFIGVIAGGSLLAALTTGLWLGLVVPAVPVRDAWVAWWLGDATGILLSAPFLIALSASDKPMLSTRMLARTGEIVVLGVLAALSAYGVFAGVFPSAIRTPAFCLPVFLWASFRFGAGGTSAVLLVATSIGVSYTLQGQGPFALPDATPAAWLQRTQGTSSMAAISFMLLGSLVAERRRVLAERAELVAKLQAALMELNVLQGMIPICAWCHKIRDDEGDWHKLEAYMEANSAATFSHGICPSCSAANPVMRQDAH